MADELKRKEDDFGQRLLDAITCCTKADRCERHALEYVIELARTGCSCGTCVGCKAQDAYWSLSHELSKYALMEVRFEAMLKDLEKLYEYESERQLFVNKLTGVPVKAMAIMTVIEGISLTLAGEDYTNCDAINAWHDEREAEREATVPRNCEESRG